MPTVNVKRCHRGHPWIFSNEIKGKEKLPPGEIVDIYQGRNFLGRGFYNPHSLIAVRRFTSGHVEFNQQFLDAAIDRALDFRHTITKEKSFRMIHSESDGLPGLIVDNYEKSHVIQVNCYGMDVRRNMIIDSLMRMKPRFIYERSDHHSRKLEGLENRQGLLFGTLANPILIHQDGLRFLVDVESGQKTGFFFDLADIRRKVRDISKEKNVLDLFCYSGSFSIYAACGGAISITGVDSSESAVALAKENCRLNGFQNMDFVLYDAFDFLRSDKKRYDLIIIDPPSFTKSRRSLAAARRGYKEINLQAIKHLNHHGILVTTSCSYHMSEEDFREILRRAAIEAGVNLLVTMCATQSLDHPILLNMPETKYLKCLFLQRID